MANKTNLFIYGTLREPSVFLEVTGDSLEACQAQEAFLTNFEAYYVKNDSFPGICQGDQKLEGIFLQVNDAVLKKLNHFEDVGKDYELRAFKVELNDAVLEAFVYFPLKKIQLSQKKWTYEEWLKESDLNAFLLRIKAFQKSGFWV